MKRLLDSIRAFLISPETLGLILPICLWAYWPAPAELAAQEISVDLKWGIGASLLPAGLLAACYNLGTDVLSPQGGRRVLLQWPDYWMLKNRVVFSLIFCAMGVLIALIGVYLIAKSKSSFGATLIFSSLLSAVAALGTVALARWKIREILEG